jgi:hypothetical protein
MSPWLWDASLTIEDVVRGSGASRVPYAVAVPLAFLASGTLMRWLAWQSGADPSGAGFAEAFCRWDCEWYVDIALGGYDGFPVTGERGIGNWAFFPLYPMTMRLLSYIVPLPFHVLAFAVSSLVSVATCLAAWRLLGRDRAVYAVFCAYLLAGPFSVYFTTFLTEPLFVLLGIGVLAALRRNAWLAAAALTALLSATRIVGVFMVFAIAWRMLVEHRRAGGRLRSFPAAVLSRPDWLLAIFLAPAGLFAYMLFLHLHMGDGLAFAHVQRSWAREAAWPWLHLHHALTTSWGMSWPVAGQWHALAAIAGICMGVWILWRRDVGVGAFILVCVVLPLTAGVASQVRFVATLVPFSLASGRGTMPAGAAAAAVVALHAAGYLLTVAWLANAQALI